ncbi:hypothetical protein JL720_5623 [Aureococcus anophagefferens]|nr:hypothetical protein JL720_5623 [Aureococcus anophagefferens]
MYESNKLTGAIDELYVYTSALDREAISVLYGSTVVTIYGNTSYIDWDDWHHYCLTYDGSDVVLYFDGLAEATAPASLNTIPGFEWAPTCTNATGAYSGDTYKNGNARNLGPTESRDGGDALGFDGEVYVVLPDALTYEALTGDEERTICLWARIDDWDGGFLFEYGSDGSSSTGAADEDGKSFGLAVGDAESNVTLALSGSYQTVVTIYGNTSYIDWDDWHHYCLTYDGTDVVLYFDGLAEAAAPASLDTATTYGLRVGADMYGSNMLTGAIDELYVYASALDSGAISVLYGSVTASPTVTPAPSTYYFEGSLLAYYPLDGGNVTDVHGTYSVSSYSGTVVEGRDGGDALLFDGTASSAVELPAALTDAGSAISGADGRTICLWAQVDAWDGGFFFSYGAAQGGARDYFALGAAAAEGNITVRVDHNREIQLPASASGDWDDWHHYCLTYDGADVVLYFDGAAAWSKTIAANTGAAVELTLGSRSDADYFTGALDEIYIYTSALDGEAIYVLYSSVTASPTVTPAPSTYYFEGTLLAYYSFDEGNATDATGAYSGDTYKNEMARNLGPTESRDGGDALGFDGNIHVALPDSLTDSALIGDEERTICLWARIDDWNGGFLFEYGDGGSDGESFGLAVGDAESNVTLALSGSYETVVTVYGNTSYIDWDDWHHYCLTYDGSDVVLYFDGFAEATAAVSLNTIPTFHMKGTLRAYYSFDEGNATDATGAYSGDTYKNGNARNLGPTESRDGGDALGFDGEVYAVLPDALTYEALTGDEERTICLWARIDDWNGGFLFEYGSDSADGASFGLAAGTRRAT